VSQRPWGPPPTGNFRGRPPQGQNPYGFNPYGQPPQGWGGQRGLSPSPYGPPGLSPYGQPPRGPAPRRRSSIGALLKTGMVLGLFLVAALVLSNLATGGGSTDNNTAYQNDDYQVPPPAANPPALPQPETYEEAEQLLVANPLYEQTAPSPVRCTAEPINVSRASDRAVEDHFNELMECLVRVWQPPLDAAGWEIVRPSVTVYGREITTRCGKSEVNAFYCGADQQVYYSNLLDDAVPVVATDKWGADVVMAHEFGHALQARTAILISSQALGQQSGDESTELELSRRLEVQADCMSGMSLRSISSALSIQQSDVRGILDVYRAVGDDTVSGDSGIVGNHGLARSREYWGQTGLNSADVASCNTYTAKANLVR
jgi:predicted metalloprotease